MSDFQDIYNEIENISETIVSMKYSLEPDDNSLWTHRDIEYNAAGASIVRLYIGETKRLYKQIYLNGIKTDTNFDIKLNVESQSCVVDDSVICEISGATDTNWISIHAINPGVYVINNEITGCLNEHNDINDSGVIVIVEDIPDVVELYWNHDNPLVIKKK